MTTTTSQITSHYARPKGLHWSPRPLGLARKHPLPTLAERRSTIQRSTSGPVVRVQDEHHEESALIEPEAEGAVGGQVGEGELESSSAGDSTSPAVSARGLPAIHTGISPEDFLRNALPSTHTFSPSSPVNHRLDITPPHRLRPSSSLSNISSGSIRSRPPSAMSVNGRVHRSDSRASGSSDARGAISSPGAASS